MSERIAVVGLGYVGLPVAIALARKYPETIGFDINPSRIRALREGVDVTGEVSGEELRQSTIRFTSDSEDLRSATFFVVAVPTPVDANRRPDLEPLRRASETVGRALSRGAVVVYESTVYPGVTEEFCGPILERASGLRRGVDFKLGYSPERINPGDREHTLERVTKVVSGEDEETLERVAAVYEAIVPAGVHRAPSIRTAEAAKVIENAQRDLNIAFMNELALIFDRLGLRTKDVLAAARTKWNFLPFTPGLVGGHCIGVDPYYLTFKAEEVGYHPQVILAGRRINDGMGAWVAQKAVKLLASRGDLVKGARVGVLGLTFKENVPDLRNSRVVDILQELSSFGIEAMVHDPLADPAEARQEFGVELCELSAFRDLHALILAVPHRAYLEMGPGRLGAMLRGGGVFMDVKSVFEPSDLPANLVYWSL
ncbi:MAG: nucleotide sugar dehydrogenase [Pseudomonadota bacterium]|nr:MAG: nucleotide sugar dehydrogenase [Pseudomonadota bacterium]